MRRSGRAPSARWRNSNEGEDAMSMTSLIFEATVAIVLVFAASLCWRLDRRLTALKNGQDGVRAAVLELGQATARAQASVADLRGVSEDAGRDLERRIATARALADELGLLTDRSGPGGRAARRDAETEDARPRARTRRRPVVEVGDPEADRLLERLKGVR
jgi:hypothetical protein